MLFAFFRRNQDEFVHKESVQISSQKMARIDVQFSINWILCICRSLSKKLSAISTDHQFRISKLHHALLTEFSCHLDTHLSKMSSFDRSFRSCTSSRACKEFRSYKTIFAFILCLIRSFAIKRKTRDRRRAYSFWSNLADIQFLVTFSLVSWNKCKYDLAYYKLKLFNVNLVVTFFIFCHFKREISASFFVEVPPSWQKSPYARTRIPAVHYGRFITRPYCVGERTVTSMPMLTPFDTLRYKIGGKNT